MSGCKEKISTIPSSWCHTGGVPEAGTPDGVSAIGMQWAEGSSERSSIWSGGWWGLVVVVVVVEVLQQA